jgi:hypothetical protein
LPALPSLLHIGEARYGLASGIGVVFCLMVAVVLLTQSAITRRLEGCLQCKSPERVE